MGQLFHIRFCGLMVLCLLLAICGSRAANATDLRLIGPIFPPYYYQKEDGTPAGDLVRLFDVVAQKAGITWQGRILPAKRVMFHLSYGEYDTSILVKNPLLEKNGAIITSERPVSFLNLNIYHRSHMVPVSTIQELRGKRVLVMGGYGYGGVRNWLDENKNTFELVEVNSFTSAVKMLETKRVDYALLYDVNIKTAEDQLGRKAYNINHSNLSRVPLYLHINRNSVPEAEKVMERMMQAYDDLVSENVLKSSDVMPDELFEE